MAFDAGEPGDIIFWVVEKRWREKSPSLFLPLSPDPGEGGWEIEAPRIYQGSIQGKVATTVSDHLEE